MNTTTAWMAWILVQFSVQILLWEKLVSGGGNSSYMLEVSVVNSFILYCEMTQKKAIFSNILLRAC